MTPIALTSPPEPPTPPPAGRLSPLLPTTSSVGDPIWPAWPSPHLASPSLSSMEPAARVCSRVLLQRTPLRMPLADASPSRRVTRSFHLTPHRHAPPPFAVERGEAAPASSSPQPAPAPAPAPASPAAARALPTRPFAFVPPGSNQPYITEFIHPTPPAPSPPLPRPPRRYRDRCANPFMVPYSQRPKYYRYPNAAGLQADPNEHHSRHPPSSPPPPSPPLSSSSPYAAVSAEAYGLVSPAIEDSFPRPLPLIYVRSPYRDAGLPHNTLNTRGLRAFNVFTYAITALVTLVIVLEGSDASGRDSTITPVRCARTHNHAHTHSHTHTARTGSRRASISSHVAD